MTTLDEIHACLARPRLALVGLSTHEQDFSRAVFKELASRGYDVVPVNPKADAIAERPAYPNVVAIPEPVGWVLVMTPPEAAAAVVADAHAAGIDHVWLHRGVGQGAVSEEAVALAKAHGMTLVAGECPLMFVEKSGFPHNVHAFFKKLVHHYPAPAQAAAHGPAEASGAAGDDRRG
jgi:predicted CoA-binding protein